VILNGHGGNTSPIFEVTRRVHRQHGLLIPNLYLWQICYRMLPELFGAQHASKAAGHGADPLTSIVMHLSPELGDAQHRPGASSAKRDPLLDLPLSGLGTAEFEGISVGLPYPCDAVYEAGVGQGDPRLSSADKGALLTTKLTDAIVSFIAQFHART